MSSLLSARPGRKPKSEHDPLAAVKIRAAMIEATRGMPADTQLSLNEIAVIIGTGAGALRQQKHTGRLPIKLRKVGREWRGSLGDVRETYFGIPRDGAS